MCILGVLFPSESRLALDRGRELPLMTHMHLLWRMMNTLTERVGYRLQPFNRLQVVPQHIPDPQLYLGPEDTSRLFRPWLAGDWDQFFTKDVLENTMLSRQKLYYLLKLLRIALTVEGDVFEAGAGSGGSARLMLNCLMASHEKRTLWVLDTFEGYQKVDARRDGSHTQVGQCRCQDVEAVRKLLENPTVPVRLVQGLIPDTLAQVGTSAICFAHIDVNLHEPTLAATVFCLDRMPRGGVIVFDDYNWPATYGARMAIDEACAQLGQEVIGVPESTQAFLIKR